MSCVTTACCVASGVPLVLVLHLSANHPEWCAAWTSILDRAAIFRRALTKPCPFCLEQRFDLQSHWKRCHVITSCCFIEILACGHGTSTDGRDSLADSALGVSSGTSFPVRDDPMFGG